MGPKYSFKGRGYLAFFVGIAIKQQAGQYELIGPTTVINPLFIDLQEWQFDVDMFQLHFGYRVWD